MNRFIKIVVVLSLVFIWNGSAVGIDKSKKDEKPKLVDTYDLEKTIGEMMTDPMWKGKLVKQLTEYGYEVLSISVVKQEVQGCTVVATVKQSQQNSIHRRKPVTRGGKPIGKPLTGKRTMAEARRNK